MRHLALTCLITGCTTSATGTWRLDESPTSTSTSIPLQVELRLDTDGAATSRTVGTVSYGDVSSTEITEVVGTWSEDGSVTARFEEIDLVVGGTSPALTFACDLDGERLVCSILEDDAGPYGFVRIPDEPSFLDGWELVEDRTDGVTTPWPQQDSIVENGTTYSTSRAASLLLLDDDTSQLSVSESLEGPLDTYTRIETTHGRWSMQGDTVQVRHDNTLNDLDCMQTDESLQCAAASLEQQTTWRRTTVVRL
ncbi:MAG: hypothetical protein KTR31_02620 [Myxococcales bacterium]|nr:hypothetical protein [Myxococcales bacterium]